MSRALSLSYSFRCSFLILWFNLPFSISCRSQTYDLPMLAAWGNSFFTPIVTWGRHNCWAYTTISSSWLLVEGYVLNCAEAVILKGVADVHCFKSRALHQPASAAKIFWWYTLNYLGYSDRWAKEYLRRSIGTNPETNYETERDSNSATR